MHNVTDVYRPYLGKSTFSITIQLGVGRKLLWLSAACGGSVCDKDVAFKPTRMYSRYHLEQVAYRNSFLY